MIDEDPDKHGHWSTMKALPSGTHWRDSLLVPNLPANIIPIRVIK